MITASLRFFKNNALDESRLLVLPTNLFTLFPSTQVPHCLHYTTEQVTETVASLEWGLRQGNTGYDRSVNQIAKDSRPALDMNTTVHTRLCQCIYVLTNMSFYCPVCEHTGYCYAK